MELITPPTPEEVNEVINNHHAEQEEEEEEVLQQPIIEIHEPSWVIDLPQQPSTDISDSSEDTRLLRHTTVTRCQSLLGNVYRSNTKEGFKSSPETASRQRTNAMRHGCACETPLANSKSSEMTTISNPYRSIR